MVFVFGAQRSGTWWLQRIVTAHPEVSAIPSETYLFELGIKPLFERFHHGLRASPMTGQLHVERDVLVDATRDFCDRVLLPYLQPGSGYLSERTPGHTHAVDVIEEVYPDARLVHIVRDGRDVARSLVAREWGPATVAEAAATWREAVTDGRRAASSDRYLEIRYEDLLTDTEPEVRRLYAWLDLPIDDEVIALATAAADRPLNEDPTDTRLAFGKWRDHFSADDVAAFEAEAGELLAELGYPTAEPIVAPEPDPEPVLAAAPPQPDAAPRRAALARRLSRRLVRREPEPTPPAPPPEKLEIGGHLARAQALADDVLGCLHAGQGERLAQLLHPEATLRVIDGDGAERTTVGAAEGAAELLADDAWRGTQLRGEGHPGAPSFSLVLLYELPGGRREARVLELDIRKELVRAATVYRLALAAG